LTAGRLRLKTVYALQKLACFHPFRFKKCAELIERGFTIPSRSIRLLQSFCQAVTCPHWMDNSDVTWEFILDNSEKRHSWRKLSTRKIWR
jgi:hypothetical protein